MVSGNVPHDQSADHPSATLIPVQVEHVDQLVLIARDLAGFVLILDLPQPSATPRSLPLSAF